MVLKSSSSDLSVNGIPVSKIHDYALRKKGNQIFHNPLQVSEISTSEVLTDYVNDIDTNDFLLLKGEQHVSGSLTFIHVQANDVTADTINAIPFGNLVTVTGEQNIRALKQMNYIQSDVLNVQGQANGEVLREVIPSIVRVDDDAELKEGVTLDGISVIRDLFLIGRMNGYIELSQLMEGTVSRYSDQQLKGRMSFEYPVTLEGGLTIKGFINNLMSNQLMTLFTNQIIPGNLVFDSTLLVAGDLATDSINDLNLKSEALLKTSDPQFVMDLKTFLQDVTADMINMTEYITLDGVDPSHLVQDWVKHKEGIVKQNWTALPNAVVLGNLTVIGGVNGHDIFDLPEIVWLKKAEQNIEVPISWKKITATHMFVTIVNTINVDSEIVHSFGDEEILSFKHFTNNVLVTTVEALEDVHINGLNTASFKTELEHYVDDGTIHGKKTIDHVEIAGDLDPSTFNNVDILQDIMHPQDYQVIYTPVQFQSELTVIKDGLNSNLVNFDRFNSVDLRSVLGNAVPKSLPKRSLKDKRFIKLKAQGLRIPDDGAINDVPISMFLNQVVTLDTEQQIIGEKTFQTNLNFGEMTSEVVNGRPLSSFIDEIVYTGDTRPVILKEFSGAFNVPSITIHRPIDGIDLLEMNKNIFNKSGTNELIYPVTFLDGVEFSKLVTAFKIDGIDLDDLIYTNLDESLGSVALLSNVNALSNVFVSGRVNGCDLQQIQKNALYANKDTQVVQEEITVENIDVIGNVYIDEVVNLVPVQKIVKKFILVSGDQAVTSNVVLNTGIQASNLNLDKLIAESNLPFIMKDAVRRSVPQNIGGYKKFRSLKSDVLEAKDLFVNGHLQDIDINDLFENIIWKRGHQSIESEKIFKTFKTDVATVQGYFNGLLLPDDIVRVDTTEVINGSSYFMSDLIMASDLGVQGKIDGVDLSNLLRNLVTLSTNQNVDSKLKFQSDMNVHGDLSIEEMVNGIALEMVAKKSGNIPLDGYKVFVNDFHIEGSMAAPSINQYSVQSMNESILKQNREEFIKDVQLFTKPIEAKNLFSDWINDISLSGITSTFFNLVNSLNGTLNYLETLSYDFWQQLSGQLDVVGNKVSKFAYFILLQEINLGPTLKILNGGSFEHLTNEFSHSMVLWTSQKQCSYLERCCHEEFSYWVRIKKSGHMMVDSESVLGRMYPIIDPILTPERKNFFIQTNSRSHQPKWCSDVKDKMTLSSLTDSKYLDVFLEIKNSPTLSDIKSFRRTHLYAVAGFYYDRKEAVYKNAVVYIFNEIKREWSEHQILHSSGVLSLDITHGTYGELLLAVGSGIGSYSTIYKWDDVQNKFEIVQYVSSTYVTSTLWLRNEQTQLLAMANVDAWPSKEAFCTELVSGGEIKIYAYAENIQWIQSIPLSGVISLVHFNLGGDTFLVAASTQLQSIFIYKWRGYSGFSLIQSMFVGEVTHLNTYEIDGDLYMTVATASGPAKVLRAVTQGKNSVIPTYDYPSRRDSLLSEAQRDEAVKEKSDCLT